MRSVQSDASGRRWHWLVYDAEGCFVRNGQTVGDRHEAENIARAAIAMMGGRSAGEIER